MVLGMELTSLDVLALAAAVLILFDGLSAFSAKSRALQRWFNFAARLVTSRNRWIPPFGLAVVVLIYAYFALQQLTILQIAPGILIGVMLVKMLLIAEAPKESAAMVKNFPKKTYWLSILVDAVLFLAIVWAIFLG